MDIQATGQLIAQARRDKGLTQKQLAAHAGLPELRRPRPEPEY